MRPLHAVAPSFLLVALLFIVGCAPSRRAAPEPARTTPLVVGVAEFATLRWLEGRWRGVEPDGAPFYEGYRFVNDSTIQTYTFADSTSVAPSDSGAIALRGGVASTGSEGSRWVVAEIGPGRIHFIPQRNARNAFTWARRAPDRWTATLVWPATAERPAREVAYEMRRLPP